MFRPWLTPETLEPSKQHSLPWTQIGCPFRPNLTDSAVSCGQPLDSAGPFVPEFLLPPTNSARALEVSRFAQTSTSER